MAAKPDLRRDVDDFLAASDKTLPVAPDFVAGSRSSQKRAVIPVEVNGESSGFAVEMLMSPNANPDWLRIVLLYGRPVWRLCLKPEFHPNSFNRPADLSASVDGPHEHRWHDNRRFARANALPRFLENARLLPASVVTKDQAFMWFLAATKITAPRWGFPSWPTREGLV